MNAEEIKEFRKKHSLTQSQLAEIIGNGIGTIKSWEQNVRDMPPSIENLLDLWVQKKISAVTILTEINYINVPYVSIASHSGYLRLYYDINYIEQLPTVPVIVDKNYKGKYIVFEVNGDSMDDTTRTFINRDLVLGQEIKREQWNIRLSIDSFFVIVTKTNGILVKQLLTHTINPNMIILRSLNHDKDSYPDIEINLFDVLQLFTIKQIVMRNIKF